MHFQHPVHLRRTAHKLHRAGVHHSERRVAVLGEVVEKDIRDCETTRALEKANITLVSFCLEQKSKKGPYQGQRIAEKDESRRRFGELIGQIFHL